MTTTEIMEQELTILFANYDEKDQKITILAGPEGGTPATLNIRLQAYDETTKKYYDDENAYNLGMEKLAKTGLTFEDIKAANYLDKTFKAYIADETRITFSKPQRFIKANLMTNREAVQLDGLEVVTSLITDQDSKNRFRVIVEVPIKVKGKTEPEVMGFLVSQLIHTDPDDIDVPPYNCGLKYSTKEIVDFEERLKDDKLPDPVRTAIKNFLASAIERGRSHKVEELKKLFDIDIEELIENGKQLRLRLVKNQIPNSVNFFLSAELLEVVDVEDTENVDVAEGE